MNHLLVGCGKCGATVGAECSTLTSGSTTDPHASRMDTTPSVVDAAVVHGTKKIDVVKSFKRNRLPSTLHIDGTDWLVRGGYWDNGLCVSVCLDEPAPRTKTPPVGFEDVLGSFKPVLTDPFADVVVAWGFLLKETLGEERFKELAASADLCCVDFRKQDDGHSLWAVITDRLTREDAIRRFGEETHEERGPKGKFKHIAFGRTSFSSKHLSRWPGAREYRTAHKGSS